MKLIYGQQRFKSKEIPQICGFMWYMLGEEMNTSHIRGNTPPPHRGNDPLEFNMAEGSDLWLHVVHPWRGNEPLTHQRK